MIAGTALLLVKVKRRRPTFAAEAWAAIGAILLFLLGTILNTHMCRAGLPYTQCAISAACFGLVMAFVADRRVRFPTAGLIVVAMFALAYHYVDLIHTREWTGNPSWPTPSAVESINRSRLRLVKDAVQAEETVRDMDFRSGWLRDLPFGPAIEDLLDEMSFERIETRWAWHTPLTLLFRKEYTQLDVWYPGGHVSEEIEELELRVRGGNASVPSERGHSSGQGQ